MTIKTTFKISYSYEDQPRTCIKASTDAEILSDILVCFEDVLRGAGFHFTGSLEIVDASGERNE